MNLTMRQLCLGLSLAAIPSLAVAQTTTAASPARTPATMSLMSGTGGVTHYPTQAAASSACGSDTVVWASPRSKALHTSDSRYFGKSKHGFFACEKTAMQGGYHLAGTGKKHKAS